MRRQLAITALLIVAFAAGSALFFTSSDPAAPPRARDDVTDVKQVISSRVPPTATGDPGRAVEERSLAPPVGEQEPDAAGNGHSQILFNLSVPESERRFCSECDPYRENLGSHFTQEQQKLLDRVADFSDYTKGEVWRIAAESPEALSELQERFSNLYEDYQAKSFSFFEARSDWAHNLLEHGQYEEYVVFPEWAQRDDTKLVTSHAGNNGPVYRVVTFPLGRNATYDTRRSARSNSLQSMTSNLNAILRRHHDSSVR